MIKIFDDCLDFEDAKSIDEKVKNLTWTYDFQTTTKKLNKHWYHMPDTWGSGLYWKIHKNLNLQTHFDIEKYNTIHLLAHTYGLEQQPHHDNCDFTIIYFPLLDWNFDWGGSLKIWDDNGRENTVDYRGNRCVIFRGEYLHQGQPPVRSCHELRIIVVFQCKIKSANADRLGFYDV